jgi:hypothetical protein
VAVRLRELTLVGYRPSALGQFGDVRPADQRLIADAPVGATISAVGLLGGWRVQDFAGDLVAGGLVAAHAYDQASHTVIRVSALVIKYWTTR